MFTGIIEAKGRVMKIEPLGQGRRLTVEIPSRLTELCLGDSINVNGACLTITEEQGQMIGVDISQETLQRTTYGGMKEGDEVNLERALRLSDRLGGHIVTGHVDGVGIIAQKRREREFVLLQIRIPGALSRYVVEKGSIAVDGISFTVNACHGETMEVTVIPYTLEETTLADKKVGDQVNIETDILAKYVEKLLGHEGAAKLSMAFLREHGFIDAE